MKHDAREQKCDCKHCRAGDHHAHVILVRAKRIKEKEKITLDQALIVAQITTISTMAAMLYDVAHGDDDTVDVVPIFNPAPGQH